jgi:hypothetical protein
VVFFHAKSGVGCCLTGAFAVSDIEGDCKAKQYESGSGAELGPTAYEQNLV